MAAGVGLALGGAAESFDLGSGRAVKPSRAHMHSRLVQTGGTVAPCLHHRCPAASVVTAACARQSCILHARCPQRLAPAAYRDIRGALQPPRRRAVLETQERRSAPASSQQSRAISDAAVPDLHPSPSISSQATSWSVDSCHSTPCATMMSLMTSIGADRPPPKSLVLDVLCSPAVCLTVQPTSAVNSQRRQSQLFLRLTSARATRSMAACRAPAAYRCLCMRTILKRTRVQNGLQTCSICSSQTPVHHSDACPHSLKLPARDMHLRQLPPDHLGTQPQPGKHVVLPLLSRA